MKWSLFAFLQLNELRCTFQDRHYMALWEECPLRMLATQPGWRALRCSESDFLWEEMKANNSALRGDTKIHLDSRFFLHWCLSSVTLSKSLNLPKPQFPHLWKQLRDGCAIAPRIHVLPSQLLYRSRIMMKFKSLFQMGRKGIIALRNCGGQLKWAWESS